MRQKLHFTLSDPGFVRFAFSPNNKLWNKETIELACKRMALEVLWPDPSLLRSDKPNEHLIPEAFTTSVLPKWLAPLTVAQVTSAFRSIGRGVYADMVDYTTRVLYGMTVGLSPFLQRETEEACNTRTWPVVIPSGCFSYSCKTNILWRTKSVPFHEQHSTLPAHDLWGAPLAQTIASHIWHTKPGSIGNVLYKLWGVSCFVNTAREVWKVNHNKMWDQLLTRTLSFCKRYLKRSKDPSFSPEDTKRQISDIFEDHLFTCVMGEFRSPYYKEIYTYFERPNHKHFLPCHLRGMFVDLLSSEDAISCAFQVGWIKESFESFLFERAKIQSREAIAVYSVLLTPRLYWVQVGFISTAEGGLFQNTRLHPAIGSRSSYDENRGAVAYTNNRIQQASFDQGCTFLARAPYTTEIW